MTHASILRTCASLGLTVRRDPASDRFAFSATSPEEPTRVRVYWTTSYALYVLGLPRVASKSGDTHARTNSEIHYLVTNAPK